MKKLLPALLILLSTIYSYAQIAASDFVTTWKTDNPGFGTNRIIIPAEGSYTLYYESVPAGTSGTLPAMGMFTGEQTITFPAAGIYRIAIKPAGAIPFHRIVFNSTGDIKKLLTIEQWGTTVWSSMAFAYQGCSNLTAISATDAPILSSVINMIAAFAACSSLVSAPNINNWNVSNVNILKSMFDGATSFNQPINNWNVSNVTSMGSMFNGAVSFNQPISNWDTGKVTDMRAMFLNATSFNQPLNNWNVSKVIDFTVMFFNAASFNQPLNKWTLSSTLFLDAIFDGNGMDCANYSNTLIGWASNPATVSNRFLGATGKIYGPGASTARTYLDITKNWTFINDSFNADCMFVSLPVQMVNFTVKAVESAVQLAWTTSTEQNNRGFDIERSYDAVHWNKIGNVNAQSDKGNSSDLLYYSFTDTNPLKGLNYYRLVQIDHSGQWQNSQIRSVTFNTEKIPELSPNPTPNKTKLTNLSQNGIIAVYNLAGQLLQRHQILNEVEEINLESYSEGIYNLVVIPDNAAAKTFKVIKR